MYIQKVVMAHGEGYSPGSGQIRGGVKVGGGLMRSRPLQAIPIGRLTLVGNLHWLGTMLLALFPPKHDVKFTEWLIWVTQSLTIIHQ